MSNANTSDRTYEVTMRVHDFGVTTFVEVLVGGERLTTFHAGTKHVDKAHKAALDWLGYALGNAVHATQAMAYLHPGNPDHYGI